MVRPLWNWAIDYPAIVRKSTDEFRTTDDWIYPLLRRALREDGVDPEKTILAQAFPDGGCDFGLLIEPDGALREANASWGSRVVTFALGLGSSCPLHLFGGWHVFNQEGRGPRDPIEALTPLIAWRTNKFRTGERGLSYRRDLIDWSLPNGLLTDIGADPLSATVMPAVSEVSDVRSSLGFGFLLPDGRVFFLAARLDSDWNPIEALEWKELRKDEVETVCGPLYDAALRFQAREATD